MWKKGDSKMNNYKQQITEEFLNAIKRQFPDMDQIQLEQYGVAFQSGFNVGASCDSEAGRSFMFDYFTNLNNDNTIN
jgi:hypothetical protein